MYGMHKIAYINNQINKVVVNWAQPKSATIVDFSEKELTINTWQRQLQAFP